MQSPIPLSETKENSVLMSTDAETPATEVNGAARTRPFTSQEYIESLRDGREIWIYGERVKDVTVHPAFRNTIRMLARLYDALHDQRKSTLCAGTDTGSGGYTHKFFKASRTTEDLVGARDAIAEWARVTYGWMGRSPDYKASFLATLRRRSREFYNGLTRRECAALVQKSAGGGDLRQSRDRKSAGRPQPGTIRGARRLYARREGD